MAESGKHVRAILDMIDAVDRILRDVPDAYTCGNMFVYYDEGNPRKVISPDVFMVRGVGKKDLRTYKTWEQQPHLDLVIEFASPSTYVNDFTEKKAIYEQILRVKEYCIYDPYGEIDPPFVGFRLVGDTYQEIAFVEGRLPMTGQKYFRPLIFKQSAPPAATSIPSSLHRVHSQLPRYRHALQESVSHLPTRGLCLLSFW